jgi:dolichyl-phosphate-mannose--protein O-mannosyl transferase
LQAVDHSNHISTVSRFDEVHFGKFASYYILREYYFDVHPPFAKLLFGLAGWFVGFDGHFLFEDIGNSYTEAHVPYVGMRALPAILGSLTIPVVYGIMKESGFSTVIAAFSAIIVLLGACLSDLLLVDCQTSCVHTQIMPMLRNRD